MATDDRRAPGLLSTDSGTARTTIVGGQPSAVSTPVRIAVGIEELICLAAQDPDFRARLLDNAPNREETVFRSKAVGEPPLMLALSVWLAIRDAVASLGPPGTVVQLDAPATPERVLAAVKAIRQ